MNIFSFSQRLRVFPVAVLGKLWNGRLEQLRINRHQDIHQILGSPHVWFILCDKRDRFTQPAHCYDVQFLCNDRRKMSKNTLNTFPLSSVSRNIQTLNGSLRGPNCGLNTSKRVAPFPLPSTYFLDRRCCVNSAV